MAKKQVSNEYLADMVRFFEQDQSKYGTETAVHNLLWVFATAQLKFMGIKRIRTS